MRKNIVRTMMTLGMVASLSSGMALTAFAEEASADTTATTTESTIQKQALNKDMVSQVFDASYYATTYKDLADALGITDVTNLTEVQVAQLLDHYMNYGIYEGRDASDVFNASVYAVANPDLMALYTDNFEGLIEHFVNFGAAEGRVASTKAFMALDNTTKANTVTQSTQAASDNGSNIGNYTVYAGNTSSVSSDNSDDSGMTDEERFNAIYNNIVEAWGNGDPNAAWTDTMTVSDFANNIAYQQVYNAFWDSIDDVVVEAGNSHVNESTRNEWGIADATYVDSLGYGHDVDNVSQEDWERYVNYTVSDPNSGVTVIDPGNVTIYSDNSDSSLSSSESASAESSSSESSSGESSSSESSSSESSDSSSESEE